MNTMLTILLSFLIFQPISYGKMFKRKARFIDFDEELNVNKNWRQLGANDRESVKALVRYLAKSATGKKILQKASLKAKQQGNTLLEVLKVGEGSLTDTTLIRRFSPERPDQINYTSRSKVFINKDLSLMDAVLDMAHELTHFTMRSPFNPYRQNFSLKDFVSSTVEGRGGEVDAYLVECKVLFELFPQRGEERSTCEKVTDPKSGKLSKTQGIKEFYRVGSFHKSFVDKLREYEISRAEVPYLSDAQANFISSAYGVPYPMAAIQEYEVIMAKVCQNDMKRLAIMKQQLDRSPASTDGLAGQTVQRKAFGRLRSSYQNRCHSFN